MRFYRSCHLVLVIIMMISAFSCKKDPLTYTKKLDGAHSWSGTSEDNGWSSAATFDQPIIYVDDKTIVFKGSAVHAYKADTLQYISTNGKTLLFASFYAAFTVEADTLTYDYKSGDIHYIRWHYDQRTLHLDVHSR